MRWRCAIVAFALIAFAAQAREDGYLPDLLADDHADVEVAICFDSNELSPNFGDGLKDQAAWA